MITWSCGGGVQSVAIGVLIREGALPVPALSGIADTGRECQSTWDYLHNVLNPYLDSVGVQVERIPHSLATVDLFAHNGDLLMPVFTGEGRLPTFCSVEWKRRVFLRWLRSKGVELCRYWLGFSLDEMQRCGKTDLQWAVPDYPLIDKRLTKGGCLRIIEAAGLPLPRKSRCWGCPHQNNDEWREVQANPDEWAKAVALDEQIRAADPEGRGDLYLHRSRMPLALVDLSETDDADTHPLFRACQDAGCWT